MAKNNTPKLRIWRVPKQYLGAFKHGHRTITRIFIDDDFSKQLLDRIIASKWTDKEAMDALAFLTKFNNEFHKNVIKKDDPNALHNTDELRKDCYERENARNRDIMSREYKMMTSLSPSDEDNALPSPEDVFSGEDVELPADNQPLDHEDIIIELIDNMSTDESEE